MGKPKARTQKPARGTPAKLTPAPAPPTQQQASHLAIPLELAQRIRAVLGTLPHDQVNEILVRMAQESKPVNLG